MTDNVRVLLVGVGGQGVLATARLLGDAAAAAGLPAILGQQHGMSQRGGSVESSVVIGPAHASGIGPGAADVVVGLEPMETWRALDRMSARTLVVSNRDRLSTFEMSRLGQPYPELDALFDRIRAAAPRTLTADVAALAREAGDARALGVVMLGWLMGLGALPLPDTALRHALERRFGGEARRVNRRAAALGVELGRSAGQAPHARERGVR